MWLSVEMWDTLAKDALDAGAVTKGAKIGGMGTLILNKWTDKQTGEDKRQLKVPPPPPYRRSSQCIIGQH